MVTILFPLVIAVVGVLVYLLAGNPKAIRIGEIVFFCGFLVLTYLLAGKQMHF